MSYNNAPIHWTYDDYLRLPDDGNRVELLDGEKCVTPAPTPRHQLVVANLLHAMQHFVGARQLGVCLSAPIDVLLSQRTVLQPDILFIRQERLSLLGDRAIEGAPDLVIEVLSASTRRHDHHHKRRLFERHGVREYWLVDPVAERIEVLALEHDRFAQRVDVTTGTARSPLVLVGFQVELTVVFAVPGQSADPS